MQTSPALPVAFGNLCGPEVTGLPPVAALPMDVGLEDTQPFSQSLAAFSLSGKHSLPSPSRPGVEDVERVMGPPSSGTRLQSRSEYEGWLTGSQLSQCQS